MFTSNYIWVFIAAAIALILPNVAQVFHKSEPVIYESDKSFRDLRDSGLFSWDYSNRWAVAVAIAGVAGVLTLLQVSEFLYFQF